MLRIAAFAGSLRRRSLNRRLLEAAVERARALEDVEVDVIDLREYPLPMFDGDLHERDGVPRAGQQIHDRIAATDAVLVANPEYNGGYPAVFKNTVDWVSRIDMLLFHPRYVGLLSATPGKSGGIRGLEHTRALFENIFVTTHEELFGLAGAKDALGDDGFVDATEAARLDAWIDGFVAAARRHRDDRRSDVA